MNTPASRYATPQQILHRAIAIEHEAETYASVGLFRQAADLRASAGDLRRLAAEAKKAGRVE
jgi:hypothetical protein